MCGPNSSWVQSEVDKFLVDIPYWILLRFRKIELPSTFEIFVEYYSLQGRLRRPTLALRFWRDNLEEKRHWRWEIFQKILFSIFEILKFYIFLVPPRSWGVHRYPWFENWSINMARAEVHIHTHRPTAQFSIRFFIAPNRMKLIS